VKLRLGELTFDPDARQLLRGEKELHLSPKAIDLLRILIAHRPRALAKQELHEHLWPATFVSEANLASLIAEVREALGDTARQPRFIRTAHRFGYAFSGEAVEVPDALQSAQPTSFCWLVKDGRRLPLQSLVVMPVFGFPGPKRCWRISAARMALSSMASEYQ
jgi:DNA-binding winged helix-turn-helix (wHTH) protein